MSRIAIVGSRDYPALAEVERFVLTLDPSTIIVSGGARGVDRTAERAAKARGLQTVVYLADWNKYGKRAGYIRNDTVIAAADEIVAFWDGKSPGTADTIRKARSAKKRVRIFES